MGMSDTGMRAWRTFLEVHAAVIRRLEAELRDERDLPLSWYDTLVQLHEADGSLRMHELADRLLLSRSATTRFADRLEASGLVTRQPCENDRRGTRITLTEEGRRRLRDAAPVHLRGVEEHFVRLLSDQDAKELDRILGRIVDLQSSDFSVA